MKNIYLLAFLLLSVSAFAQKKQREAEDQARVDLIHKLYTEMQIDSSRDENGSFVLSSIIRTPDSGLSKDQIFELVKFTIYKNFGSGDQVIQYESKQEGKIYCRAKTREFPYYNTGSKQNGGSFNYEITGLCKDGKTKIVISNISHMSGSMTQMRDGSDFGDSFPIKWNEQGDGLLGRAINKQSLDQWSKIKNMAHLDLIGTIALFQSAIQKAMSKTEEF